MVKERNVVNNHIKEIQIKKTEVTEVKLGVEDVEVELKSIKENESEYLRLQNEYYKRMQEQEQENEENELLKKPLDKGDIVKGGNLIKISGIPGMN
jgi:uncharacterized protein YfaS (alpha-2-macroglobulin family)